MSRPSDSTLSSTQRASCAARLIAGLGRAGSVRVALLALNVLGSPERQRRDRDAAGNRVDHGGLFTVVAEQPRRGGKPDTDREVAPLLDDLRVVERLD